jgi:NAD(P)H dehydrogenase (quinone)
VKVLVVVADPVPDSYVASLGAAATEALTASGHDVDVADLYADGFDPVMSPAERAAYHSEAPVVAVEVHDLARRVKAADALVFVYPTWWTGMPAVLKGWFDRVLVPGVAFVFDGSGRIRPGLRNVTRLAAVTTYEAPSWRVRLLGDPGRRTIARTLRMNVSRRARTRWLALHGVGTSTAEDRARFEALVRRRMAQL